MMSGSIPNNNDNAAADTDIPNESMISGNDYLKVLICSANVGNAEPTPTSFGAWIPDDGEINGPITNTLYPLGHMERTLAVGPYGAAATASSSANNNDNYNNNNNNSNNKISSSHEDEIIQSLLFTSSDNNNNNDNTTTNGKKDKFDIIVLGMQEAAFVNKQKKECGGGGDNNNGTTTTTITTTTTSSIRSSSAASSSEMERVHNNNNNSNDNDDDDNNNNGGGVNHDNNNDNKSSSPPTKKKGFNPLRKGAKKAAKAGMVMRGISANQTYNGLSSNSSGGGGGGGGVITSNVLGYDNNKLADLIQTRCPSYEIITSSLRGEMRLFVLVQSHLTQDISNVYIAAENTGIGSIMANKGGIIVTLTFRNMTRFSFMTCHLEAHEGMQHYIQRNKNLAEILGGAKTDPVYAMQDATIFSHHMFVCGDLNYRIKFSEYEKMKEKKKKFMTNLMMKKMSMKGTSSSSGGGDDDDVGGGLSSLSKGASCDEAEEEEEEESNNHKGDGGGGGEGEKKDEPANGSHFDQAKALVEAEDWKALNEGDELAGALKQKECLVGFSTLPCHWPPTFKVARGEGYQYNEKRTPSYTDRILWKSAEGMVNNVIPFLYEPCPEFITSDHKPIRGGFAVKLNKDQPSCTEKTSDSAPIERRGSGVFVRTIPNLKTAAHHDEERQIQILVSDLKCTNLPIMDNEFVGGLSDPYVLFVSSPKELLFSKAWPSSSIIPKNLNPVWKEDMYLTMDRKGMRNGQLAEGSMLMLTVMDYDATSGDDVIGSVALNLNELCSKLDLSAGGPPGKVQETYISRPILRNGQEYGMLECKLKTAFLAPKEVKSFLSGAKNVRTAMKTSWKSKIQAFTGFAAMS